MSSLVSERFGLLTKRITKDERFDLRRGVDTALMFIESHTDVDAWSAIPCTAWCTWTFLNESRLGPRYAANLAYRRRQSIKMVGHAEECMAAAIASGGAGHFEWPRRCRGWQRRIVQQMIHRLKMLLADFDGCSFGVLAGPDLLALKPWTVATTRPRLAASFAARRCSGDHPHGGLSGTWATKSGHYTESMCLLALEAMTCNEECADAIATAQFEVHHRAGGDDVDGAHQERGFFSPKSERRFPPHSAGPPRFSHLQRLPMTPCFLPPLTRQQFLWIIAEKKRLGMSKLSCRFGQHRPVPNTITSLHRFTYEGLLERLCSVIGSLPPSDRGCDLFWSACKVCGSRRVRQVPRS